MRFELTVLGSNGALPAPHRHASAHFFRSESTDILLDCGEGTQMRLQSAGLGMGRVDLILITHLHGDHYFGLPGLLTSLSLNGRRRPLRIVSPAGLEERIAPLLELQRYDLPFPVEFQPHDATTLSQLTTIEDVEVWSFPLRHRIATNGYLIREKQREANIIKDRIETYAIPWQAIPGIKGGAVFRTEAGEVIPNADLTLPAPPPRSYAYCTDTVYFPELADWVRGVNLLYHEATFRSDMAAEAAQRGHSTAAQAARIALAAGVGRLVIGHFSARYADARGHEREARSIFPNAYAAGDLHRYVVPFTGRDSRSDFT